MRYLIGLVLALAILTLPLRGVAQATEGAGSDERPQLALLLIPEHLEERLPQHRHAAAKRESKFSLEYQERKKETDPQVKRAKIGLVTSSSVASVGFVLGMAAGFSYAGSCWSASFNEEPCVARSWVAPVGWTGVALLSVGVVGQAASGIPLARRKRELGYAHNATPHRVQWDLARSRLVF